MNRMTLTAIAAIIVIALLALGAQRCTLDRAAATKARIEKGQTGAVLESGMDSSNTQAGIATNDAATADLNRSNAEDIRNAEGSNAVVADGARAAWLRALCQRKANLDRPECRVQ